MDLKKDSRSRRRDSCDPFQYQKIEDEGILCRMCLERTNVHCSEEISSVHGEEKEIIDYFLKNKGKEVNECDGKLPQLMCSKCEQFVIDIVNFRHKCLNLRHSSQLFQIENSNQKIAFCRLCGDNMKPRRLKDEGASVEEAADIVNKIKKICRVNITENEPSPKFALCEVCRECRKMMERIKSFETVCRGNQEKLYDMLLIEEDHEDYIEKRSASENNLQYYFVQAHTSYHAESEPMPLGTPKTERNNIAGSRKVSFYTGNEISKSQSSSAIDYQKGLEEMYINICRLCREPNASSQLVDIFSDSSKNVDLSGNIKKTCGICVKENDLMPKRICHRCDAFVIKMIVFRAMCRRVQLSQKDEKSSTTNQVKTRCRLCNSNMKYRRNHEMFENEGKDIEFICKVSRTCGVDIIENEALPKLALAEICRVCEKFVVKMWDFRKLSEISQWEFRNMITANEAPKSVTFERKSMVRQNKQYQSTPDMIWSQQASTTENNDDADILSLRPIKNTEKSLTDTTFRPPRSQFLRRADSISNLFSRRRAKSVVDLNDTSAYCRLCKTIGLHEIDLFSVESRQQSYVRFINNVCSVGVAIDDKMSNRICRKCDKFICKMSEFRTMCETSHLDTMLKITTYGNQQRTHCRLCARRMKTRHRQGIFYETNNDEEFISKIKKMAGVDVTEDDPGSKIALYEICRDCEKFVIKMWNFRKQCLATQWDLRNMVTMLETRAWEK